MSSFEDVEEYPAEPESKKFEELSITELPGDSSSYRMMTETAEAPYSGPPKPVDANNEHPTNVTVSDTCLQEPVVERCISPRVNETEGDSQSQDEAEIPFPPTLYKRVLKIGEKDKSDSEIFYEMEPPKKETSETDYDSDDTVDDYVKCGEEGICKCQKMVGRQYYDYYLHMKNTEDYTVYPQGKCILPKGTILHFSVAPDKLKREDIHKALVELGAKIEFIDFQKGNKEGFVRLSYAHEARVIIKKMTDKKLCIAEADVNFRVLSGKEEKKYLKKVIEEIFKLQQKAKGLKKNLKKHGYKYLKKINDSAD